MRFINILGAAAVLVCAIWVSFAHSIELFHQAGFTGRLSLVGVVMTEVGFITSALNIVTSRLRREKPGSGAVAGFLLGVGMVLWANIRSGLAAGLTGVIIGGVVPLWLLVAEISFSQAVMRRKPAATAQANPAATQGQPEPVAPTAKAEYEPPKAEPVTQVKIDPPKVEYIPPEAPAKLTVVKPTRPTEPPKVGEPPAQEEELGEVGEMALKLYQENGRITRRQLAELANITEWRARQVIEELKTRQYLQNSLA